MDTLVLDQSFTPVARVPWQRAITLLFEEKVEAIETHDRVVRSASEEWRVPSVIRFFKAVRGRKRAIKFSRESVYARDRGRCQYCGLRVPPDAFTYDHVVPRAAGGHTRWENVVVACTPCNQRKGGRTPEQARMHLIAIPIRPQSLPDSWKFQFVWREGMPPAWRSYLRDVTYWAGEMQQD